MNNTINILKKVRLWQVTNIVFQGKKTLPSLATLKFPTVNNITVLDTHLYPANKII